MTLLLYSMLYYTLHYLHIMLYQLHVHVCTLLCNMYVLFYCRMDTGLTKLVEATAAVDELSKELVVKEKELEVANDKADKVLAEVAVSTQGAEKVSPHFTLMGQRL